MFKKFFNDDKAFTGLEAAIVLVAFVVVAAVFSYVMLGAGFYTTQKSQEVVHTGVAQASSSLEVSGDVIASGNITANTIENVTVFVQLTAGGSPIDMNRTIITYTDLNNHASFTMDDPEMTVPAKYGGADADNLLEKFEKFEVRIDLSSYSISANDEFQFEIKPPEGASYTLQRSAPPQIDAIMTLY
ncbi:archaellin/type IV pilin N-terminal domain-containing protein [Methanococcoides burtonii]|uniref:Flagellin n=1 Tax=Methanococcoides burtonii (strain DSM 6242 / NBRC 107633 / OCM 468 / ACE-M) TaxID=259564 RepID=Q12YY4_METBU|nr:archaellin/type IV pilin N-terminal domain-containing protein [Methanococcoides burtonii]ABE51342.1 flagellin [Methanococcoides burtonii DSM 6242]